MGVVYNSSVSTRDLVLYLDAANPRSYPGSGSTWYDLSLQKNNVTLFNSPTYTNGYFTFNGTNTYGVTQGNLDLSLTDRISIITVVRSTTTAASMVLEHSTNANGNNAFFVLFGPDAGGATPAGSLEFADHVSTYNLVHTSTLANTGNWAYCTVTSNRSLSAAGQSSIYLNGVNNTVINTGLSTDLVGNYSTFPLYIGARGGSSVFYPGDISVIMIYKRTLTSEEIQQNFNAIRGRYSL